jgi:hypothetical protein
MARHKGRQEKACHDKGKAHRFARAEVIYNDSINFCDAEHMYLYKYLLVRYTLK